MKIGGGGGKGDDIKVILHLCAPPVDGPLLQIHGEITIGGG